MSEIRPGEPRSHKKATFAKDEKLGASLSTDALSRGSIDRAVEKRASGPPKPAEIETGLRGGISGVRFMVCGCNCPALRSLSIGSGALCVRLGAGGMCMRGLPCGGGAEIFVAPHPLHAVLQALQVDVGAHVAQQ